MSNTVVVYYDPSKERPFKRDGDRIFVTSQNEDVPIRVGTNLLLPYVVEEIKKDSFYSKLIEYEALIVREESPVLVETTTENSTTLTPPVAPETEPVVPTLPITPATAKSVKPLR